MLPPEQKVKIGRPFPIQSNSGFGPCSLARDMVGPGQERGQEGISTEKKINKKKEIKKERGEGRKKG